MATMTEGKDGLDAPNLDGAGRRQRFLQRGRRRFWRHGVLDPLAKELVRTGANYEAIHALATIACAAFIDAGARRAGYAPALFLTGSVIFCGSLYGLAFGAPRWLGVATPIGGLLFLAGWAVVAWRCLAAEWQRPEEA
jgi:uncharacterized membrane protein YgdD (TMEM256/DUF423 family)